MRLGNLLPVALLAACGGGYGRVIELEGDAESGEYIYAGNCEDCHGADGEGITGPALTERLPLMTSTDILEQIESGGGDMPSYEGDFTDQELADLLEYLTLTFQ